MSSKETLVTYDGIPWHNSVASKLHELVKLTDVPTYAGRICDISRNKEYVRKYGRYAILGTMPS